MALTPVTPVAVYSYQLDAAGGLLDPQPLEGATLQRKSVYFSFTGEHSKIKIWCCKVPDGAEEHMAALVDDAVPLVLRVDMQALPDDDGLQRELYADLFDVNGDYEGHFTHWTLEPPERGYQAIFDDGGVHTLDRGVPGADPA